MKELPVPQYLANGHMVARFLRVPRKHELLLVAVPGGPALPSRYLDEFMEMAANAIGANAAVLDFPNHGSSVIPFDKLPVSYGSCFDYVGRTLAELSELTEKLVVVGHHAGARMLLELIVDRNFRPRASVFINTPGGTCSSGRWKAAMLDFFSSGISSDAAANLAADIRWDGNERILDRAPALRDTLAKVSPSTPRPPMAFLDGEREPLDGDEHFDAMRTIFSHASYERIPKTQAFSMLENPADVTKKITSIYTKGLVG